MKKCLECGKPTKESDAFMCSDCHNKLIFTEGRANCLKCGAKNLLLEDMHDETRCLNCFERMIDNEQMDYDIFIAQYRMCFICMDEMKEWKVVKLGSSEKKIAVCTKHLPPYIQEEGRNKKLS